MYRIRPIDGASAHDIEYLGTKRKFWMRLRGTRHLFKAEERGTGEDWAEKVVCELAAAIGLPHVKYHLAQESGGGAGDRPGVICPSFVLKGQSFEMGNQLLLHRDPAYPAGEDAKYNVRAHTVNVVVHALRELEVPDNRWMRHIPAGIQTALDVFIGYVMLDAWVANQDRHHQNWGAVRLGEILGLAPTYDHGSALARNLTDKEREARLVTRDKNYSVSAFASKARSGFYRKSDDVKTLHPLEAYKDFAYHSLRAARTWMQRLESRNASTVEKIMNNVPTHRMSEITRAFTMQLLEVNRTRLLEQRLEA